ncbi:hypothetical protein SUDANB105_03354 [Streptomyces sp. enrichment culture]|uniref:glycosyltransferase n=1 Tax=Streptomyces sp. enrichment culture TaxID=1795815 RepID=UPI003F57DC51
MPHTTVICPAYNRGRAIVPTLESVCRQTMTDWELIVVSDASSDDTDDWVRAVAARDRRVRLLRTPRFGSQSGPTNLALAEASGAYVAYLDHDDLWEPGHLRLLAEAFDAGAEFVATRTVDVDATGAVHAATPALAMVWHPELQLMSPLFENSCAGHVAGLAQRVGGWRESAVGLEDWDLWLRFADVGVRCTTHLDKTVRVLQDPGTRQHSMPCDHRHEIARFDSMLAARAALRTLCHPALTAAEREATRKDVVHWYTALAERGELVFPRGWEGGADALPAAVDAQLRGSADKWRGLVVERHADRVSLSQLLPTMTAEHAARYSAFFRRTMRHQQDFLCEVLPEGSVVR